MQSIKDVLEPKEKILWRGKPVFIPFLLSAITISSVIGIFILSQFIPTIRYSGLLPIYFGIFMVFGPIIYRLMVYTNVFYYITDRRVIFESGIFAKNFRAIDFDQVANAQVNIDIFDKLFGNGSGSIVISTSGNFAETQGNTQFLNPYALANIANPYKVFKFFEKVAQDIKTDVYYPNDLRPKQNPGYNTSYKSKKLRD